MNQMNQMYHIAQESTTILLKPKMEIKLEKNVMKVPTIKKVNTGTEPNFWFSRMIPILVVCAVFSMQFFDLNDGFL